MTDVPVIHIGENSPEHVAYRLFLHIATAEGQGVMSGSKNPHPTKAWILNTYAECLRAVRSPYERS